MSLGKEDHFPIGSFPLTLGPMEGSEEDLTLYRYVNVDEQSGTLTLDALPTDLDEATDSSMDYFLLFHPAQQTFTLERPRKAWEFRPRTSHPQEKNLSSSKHASASSRRVSSSLKDKSSTIKGRSSTSHTAKSSTSSSQPPHAPPKMALPSKQASPRTRRPPPPPNPSTAPTSIPPSESQVSSSGSDSDGRSSSEEDADEEDDGMDLEDMINTALGPQNPPSPSPPRSIDYSAPLKKESGKDEGGEEEEEDDEEDEEEHDDLIAKLNASLTSVPSTSSDFPDSSSAQALPQVQPPPATPQAKSSSGPVSLSRLLGDEDGDDETMAGPNGTSSDEEDDSGSDASSLTSSDED
ncbi:MAG: hypothetical protein DHS80DRAFT_31261 [Piptocephalis tieghemiana]|nr:MAG: hypothetical protein DHS80DRAFT_31261 [Piptocephalis tieghemiana]